MGALEQQEAALKKQFGEAPGSITKRRVTTQMLQLRKDLERRQQLLQVLNQQINVVSTHLHNLELVQQGQSAALPDTDEITADAVKAEEMLAELEANAELAGSVGAVSSSGMTAEEQELFKELERETGGKDKSSVASTAKPEANKTPGVTQTETAQRQRETMGPTGQSASPSRRSEPEAG